MHGSASRFGSANPLLVMVVGGLAAIGLLVGLLVWFSGRGQDDGARRLVMYCAAGLRVPVEKIADQYETEYGVRVEMQFAGSNTLLSQLEVNREGQADLYLAADESYIDLARQKGLAAEVMPIADMRPVIAVAKGNPKNIQSIDDLLRDDVRVALGNPDQTAIGRAVREALSAINKGDSTEWDQLEAHVTRGGVFKPTVNEVANDVKIGSVDAGVVWDSTLSMPEYRNELAMVPVPAFDAETSQVRVAVLKSSRHPRSAIRFARYLSARDRGLPVFKASGLEPVMGDVWALEPEITFFCGAVNRRSVDKLIREFEQREGVRVNTVYNGCGILTGQMRTIDQKKGEKGFPDVYMACDRYYLENVRDWFQEDVDVSEADIVIAVAEGNPKQIKSLADLAEPGMRVAVGQPKQCTIGALTRILLEKEQLYDEISKNVVMQTSSSSMLVPGVVVGSVDAAIAYVTDTIAESDKVDVVRIDSPYAKAVQPFSIAKISDHKYLGRRLFRTLVAASDPFEEAGFRFLLDKEPRLIATTEPSEP